MYFKRKLDELTAFIDHLLPADNATKQLKEFVNRWGMDTREELGLPLLSNGTVGISFDPSIELVKQPSAVSVKEGMYFTRDGSVGVEVIGQDPVSGLVQIERVDPDTLEHVLETLSSTLFVLLFEPA